MTQGETVSHNNVAVVFICLHRYNIKMVAGNQNYKEFSNDDT